MIETFDVRSGTLEDIPGLLRLNSGWLKQNVHGDTSKGFVSGAFNEEDFRSMINDKMISLAHDGDTVVSYMLSMNNSSSDILMDHANKAKQIREDGTVAPESRIAIGVQTAVDERFHGSGLINRVRAHFIDLLSDRFNYLFTTISKQNPRSYKSATKYGWITVGDNDHHYYLIYKV
ncbi:MAG: hypothetical protein EOP56_06905 [Sphingobacteriales bacterium]|nr:MAG: hypothetical protein EOP56_06905 [Sphingobacteriales bacterium]